VEEFSKHADFAVCSILITSAQNSIDSLQLREVLEHYRVIIKTTNQLIECYEKFKDELTERLSKLGNTFDIPTLCDVDYEIQQHYIPSGDVTFKLMLKEFDSKAKRSSVIKEFNCNFEELQLLISKLKDIERHCERIALLN
jgi:DNA integrity scanning protein DisA with diadenylate cyclase activity